VYTRNSSMNQFRLGLWVLFGAVGFLLMIACVNVASLTLSRAASRVGEMALRTAIGAARLRIVRQLLTESLMLACISGVCGGLLAVWGVRMLVRFSPTNIPRLEEISIDLTVLVFTAFIAVCTAVLFGLVPAWQSARANVSESLRGGRSSSDSLRGLGMRHGLVVAEVALTLILMIGAGLMMRSFRKLLDVDLGFDSRNLLTFRVNLPGAQYPRDDQLITFFRQLHERLESLPGVRSVGMNYSLPNVLEVKDSFTVEGQPLGPNDVPPIVPSLFASSGYFKTLGIPLLRGRLFADTDNVTSTPIVVINETLAHRYFASEDPIGRRIKLGGADRPKAPWMEIVGVVGDVKYSGPDSAPEPAFYRSYVQVPLSTNYFVVRTEGDPLTIADSVRREVWALDRNMPVASLRTMENIVDERVGQPRFRAWLVTLFAVSALTLASVGVYGVVAYNVTQRTHEYGIRLALGATPREILKVTLFRSLRLTTAGLLIGVVASVFLMRTIRTLLFDVSPGDPVTFIATTLLLGSVAGIASFFPARKATRVDPMVSLRCD